MTTSAGKVLIFGASGHIGGPVARFMRYKGWRERLRLATSSAAKLDQLKASFPDCETVVADYLNLDSLNDALKGVRTVFVIPRSEERRLGKECVSTGRYWWSRDH